MEKKFLKIGLFLSLFFSFKISFAADAFKTYGDIGQIALPVAALGVTYFQKDWQGFTEFAYAFLATGTTVEVLKYTVNRKRPNGGDHSFPSGHTAAAFAGASFLQMRYGWTYGIPAYIAAATIGYSRIESRNHWTTDVLAGAAIGIGANLIFTKPYQGIHITPYYDSNRQESGVELSAKF